ncbi:hypothetical protein [Nostoc sp.]|uniref:hypothetical protein n=1 Tax=Nostoc sp. TaxID=1180 RepID=UPI0035948687
MRTAICPIINDIRRTIVLVNPDQVLVLGGGSFPEFLVSLSFSTAINNAPQAFKQGVIGGNIHKSD